MATAGSSSRVVEGLVDVMDDATRRWQEPLTLDRLCAWQVALFPHADVAIHRVAVGVLRTGPEPMQIVSGPITHPTVHYEAPSAEHLAQEVSAFIRWFETTRPPPPDGRLADGVLPDGLLRAGIAHLWFETLHPFEDGNGRIGRAIVDLALAQDSRIDQRLYSASRRLAAMRDEYYAELAAESRGGLDITHWLAWFVRQFEHACAESEIVIDRSLAKARFWLEHAGATLNEQQRKVINWLLNAGPGGVEGGMSTSKYEHLAGTSRATAYRDLEELVRLGLLEPYGVGRGTRYRVAVEGWR